MMASTEDHVRLTTSASVTWKEPVVRAHVGQKSDRGLPAQRDQQQFVAVSDGGVPVTDSASGIPQSVMVVPNVSYESSANAGNIYKSRNTLRSRARPRRPEEPMPFLCVDNLPADTTVIDGKINRSSSIPVQKKAIPSIPKKQVVIQESYVPQSASGRRTPSASHSPVMGRMTPRSPSRNASSLHNYNSFFTHKNPAFLAGAGPPNLWNINNKFWPHTAQPPERRKLAPLPTGLSVDVSAMRPNLHVAQPFKHETGELTLYDRPFSPSHDMKDRTLQALNEVTRALTQRQPPQSAGRNGKLLKGRLKPLHTFKLDGPSIDQCQGVQPEPDTRMYTPSQSRLRQRKQELLRMLPPDILKPRPQTQESIHRTSIASNWDEERYKDFESDIMKHDIESGSLPSTQSRLRHPVPRNTPGSGSSADRFKEVLHEEVDIIPHNPEGVVPQSPQESVLHSPQGGQSELDLVAGENLPQDVLADIAEKLATDGEDLGAKQSMSMTDLLDENSASEILCDMVCKVKKSSSAKSEPVLRPEETEVQFVEEQNMFTSSDGFQTLKNKHEHILKRTLSEPAMVMNINLFSKSPDGSQNQGDLIFEAGGQVADEGQVQGHGHHSVQTISESFEVQLGDGTTKFDEPGPIHNNNNNFDIGNYANDSTQNLYNGQERQTCNDSENQTSTANKKIIRIPLNDFASESDTDSSPRSPHRISISPRNLDETVNPRDHHMDVDNSVVEETEQGKTQLPLGSETTGGAGEEISKPLVESEMSICEGQADHVRPGSEVALDETQTGGSAIVAPETERIAETVPEGDLNIFKALNHNQVEVSCSGRNNASLPHSESGAEDQVPVTAACSQEDLQKEKNIESKPCSSDSGAVDDEVFASIYDIPISCAVGVDISHQSNLQDIFSDAADATHSSGRADNNHDGIINNGNDTASLKNDRKDPIHVDSTTNCIEPKIDSGVNDGVNDNTQEKTLSSDDRSQNVSGNGDLSKPENAKGDDLLQEDKGEVVERVSAEGEDGINSTEAAKETGVCSITNVTDTSLDIRLNEIVEMDGGHPSTPIGDDTGKENDDAQEGQNIKEKSENEDETVPSLDDTENEKNGGNKKNDKDDDEKGGGGSGHHNSDSNGQSGGAMDSNGDGNIDGNSPNPDMEPESRHGDANEGMNDSYLLFEDVPELDDVIFSCGICGLDEYSCKCLHNFGEPGDNTEVVTEMTPEQINLIYEYQCLIGFDNQSRINQWTDRSHYNPSLDDFSRSGFEDDNDDGPMFLQGVKLSKHQSMPDLWEEHCERQSPESGVADCEGVGDSSRDNHDDGRDPKSENDTSDREQACNSSSLEVVASAVPRHTKSDNKVLPSVVPICFRINALPPEGSVYYFAYGADMNYNRMKMYVGGSDIQRFWGVLYGFQLVFNRKGSDAESGGFPNIQLNAVSSVEGCVYCLTKDQLLSLDAMMGFPKFYVKVVLPVWMLNCLEPSQHGVAQYCIPAVMYVAKDEWTHTEGENPLQCSYNLSQCLKGGDLLTPEYIHHMKSLEVC